MHVNTILAGEKFPWGRRPWTAPVWTRWPRVGPDGPQLPRDGPQLPRDGPRWAPDGTDGPDGPGDNFLCFSINFYYFLRNTLNS